MRVPSYPEQESSLRRSRPADTEIDFHPAMDEDEEVTLVKPKKTLELVEDETEADIEHNLREAARHADDRKEHVEAYKSPVHKTSSHEAKVILNIREQIKEPKQEVKKDPLQKLQEELSDKNNEEGNIHEELNRKKLRRGPVIGFFRWLSKITGGVASTTEELEIRELEARLEGVNADQSALLEEIQSIQLQENRSRIQSARAGIPRKAAMTPTRELEQDRVRREQREEDRVAAQKLETPTVGMTEEGAEVAYGLATPEEALTKMRKRKAVEQKTEERAKARKERQATPRPAPELKLPEEITAKAAEYVAKQELPAMNIAEAATILHKERAAKLWETVKDAMKKKPEVMVVIGGSNINVREHPATIYVFTAAEATRAQQQGDNAGYDAAMQKIERWNVLLGLRMEDLDTMLNPEVTPVAPAAPEAPTKLNRMRGRDSRGQTTNRSNTRFRF